MVRASDAFVEPPWGAPLDAEATIARIPASATMKGMFLAAVVDRARAGGFPVPTARDRYVPFRWYPLREHAELLVEVARAVWPKETLRQGLRRLGRGAAQVLSESTLGKVTIGSVETPHDVLRQMGRSFELLSRPGKIELVESGPGFGRMELRGVHFFASSHHVGVYEGALRFAKADNGRVRLRERGEADVDLLCEWDG